MESRIRTLLRASRVFDGERVFEPGFVVVEGDRVGEVGMWRDRADLSSPDVTIIELEGGTLLPGLVNAHTHLAVAKSELGPQMWSWPEGLLAIRAARVGEAELRTGVTTARDLGERGNAAFIHKRAIEMGLVAGPRLLVAGQLLCITGGHGYHMGIEVDGVDEVRTVVRRLLKAGVDVVKLIASGGMNVAGTHPIFSWDVAPGAQAHDVEMSAAELRTAVEEAQRVGKPVAAHAYGMPAIRNCIEAGVTSIEHGTWLDSAGAEALAERGIALVPAISGNVRMAERAIPLQVRERASRALEAHRTSVALAHAAGVPIGIGTDSQGDMASELEILVALGIPEAAALRSATRLGAAIVKLDGVGSLATGYFADVLGVDGNPLEDIRHIRNVRFVMKGGHVILSH